MKCFLNISGWIRKISLLTKYFNALFYFKIIDYTTRGFLPFSEDETSSSEEEAGPAMIASLREGYYSNVNIYNCNFIIRESLILNLILFLGFYIDLYTI